MLPGPPALVSIPTVPEFFSEEKIADVAEVNQWHCLEESGQWLENVDRTHLVLASGKLILQKSLIIRGTAEHSRSVYASHRKFESDCWLNRTHKKVCL